MEILLKLFDEIIENFDFSILKNDGDFKNKYIFVLGKNKFIRSKLSESSFPDGRGTKNRLKYLLLEK